MTNINGKYLLKSKREWYDTDEFDFQICTSKQLVKSLARFLIENEKDYHHSYEIYNLSELNKNDSDAIQFLLNEELNKLSKDTIEERIKFYENMLRLKIEELQLIENNSFNPELYNLDNTDLEITKLEEILEKLKNPEVCDECPF